jgi:hypothetical protein
LQKYKGQGPLLQGYREQGPLLQGYKEQRSLLKGYKGQGPPDYCSETKAKTIAAGIQWVRTNFTGIKAGVIMSWLQIVGIIITGIQRVGTTISGQL